MNGGRALAWNLAALSRIDCGPAAGGIALQRVRDRHILWTPCGDALLAIDVSDPRAPAPITRVPFEGAQVTGAAVDGGHLAIATTVVRADAGPAGLTLFDASDPTAPRKVGALDLAQGGSRGAGAVCLSGDGRAHLAAVVPGDSPVDPRDDMAYMVVGIADAVRPDLLGHWRIPAGRRVDPRFDTGRRVHSARVFPARPDRAYVACGDAGLAVLDVSDPARPRAMVQWGHSPPYHGGTCAVALLPSRGYVLVADQPVDDGAADWPKRVWMVDLRAETKALPVGMLPAPPLDAFRARPGRLGAYDVQAQGDLAFIAFGSGGLRVVDVTDPYSTFEVGYFVPPDGEVSAVMVDDRDVVYAFDRRGGALYSLALEL